MNDNNPNKIPSFESYDEIGNHKDGWISPEGKFYPCRNDQHDESAEYLIGIYADGSEDLGKTSRTLIIEKGFVQLSAGKIKNDQILTFSQKHILMKAGYDLYPHIPQLPDDLTVLLQKRTLPILHEILAKKLDSLTWQDNMTREIWYDLCARNKWEKNIYFRDGENAGDEIWSFICDLFDNLAQDFEVKWDGQYSYNSVKEYYHVFVPERNSPYGIVLERHIHNISDKVMLLGMSETITIKSYASLELPRFKVNHVDDNPFTRPITS